MIDLPAYLSLLAASPLAPWSGSTPWSITGDAERIVTSLLSAHAEGYERRGDVRVHASATVENGAVVKGPAVVGPHCFVAAGAYLRGGVWLDEHCILGPGAELKSSFMFRGSKLAHFNFVGDSILGAGVNLEAGSIVANYRNEREDKEIRVRVEGVLHRTGASKFGALIGDGARIGANAVVAPGALIVPAQVVRRLTLLDQEVDPAATGGS